MSFVLWLNYYYIVFLDCLSLFLHYHTSLIKFSFRTCGRGRRLKPFYKQEARRHAGGDCSWEGPPVSYFISVAQQAIKQRKPVALLLSPGNSVLSGFSFLHFDK